jgi:nicotinic acetylcholine receptor alpha-7
MLVMVLFIPFSFKFDVYSLLHDQDERNQILTTNCWLTQIWTDHHLKWNASDFAGIRVVRVPYHRVWRPDIILYNK